MFQQDGATPHTSDSSQKWCEKNLFKFLDKKHWPPNSPDLNPLDFYFWNAVVSKITFSRGMSLENLKEEITKAFETIDSGEIKKCIESFTGRVRAVENANGEYVHS